MTYRMIRELFEKLKMTRPRIAPINVWQAYQQLEATEGAAKTELTALVALVRRVCGIDEKLTTYEKRLTAIFRIGFSENNPAR